LRNQANRTQLLETFGNEVVRGGLTAAEEIRRRQLLRKLKKLRCELKKKDLDLDRDVSENSDTGTDGDNDEDVASVLPPQGSEDIYATGNLSNFVSMLDASSRELGLYS